MRNTLFKIYKYIIDKITLIFLLFLSVLSFIFTAYMNQNASEITLFSVNIIQNLFFCFIFCVLFYLYQLFMTKINEQKFFKFSLLIIFIGLLLLNISLNPILRGDGFMIYQNSTELLSNNMESLLHGGYLYMFPNQLGLVILVELLLKVFGNGAIQSFRLLNCIATILILFSLHEFIKIYFKEEKYLKIFDIIMYFCLPLFYYTTFFYGNVLAIMFCLLSLLFQLYSFNSTGKKRILFVLLTGISIALGIFIKSNSLITLVALILQYIFNHEYKGKIVSIFIVLICCLISKSFINFYVQNQYQAEVSKGVPMTSFLAMGLQESYRAPGWFNGYNYEVFIKNSYDRDKTMVADLKSINKSINKFISDPIYALKFFGKKTVSQWNNPSFQCFWIQGEHNGQYNVNYISTHLLHEGGKLRNIQEYTLDAFEFLIYFCALITWITFKKEDTSFYSLGLVFVGGFIFHLFWEAKCQYTLQYFIGLIPYSVYGVNYVMEFVNNHIQKFKKQKFI